MSLSRRTFTLLLSLGCLPTLAAAQSVSITGTGATFPAEVYAQWARQYSQDTGVKLSYVPSGSSAGIKQIVARAVDFGATDVPLSQAELDKNQLFQFPTLVGGVVAVVNLPGVASGALRLSSEVLAAIFAGDIQRWNDKAVAALNPSLTLPDARIVRVVRADGSGTTEIFVSYLKQTAAGASSAIEPQGTKAKWPGSVTAVEGSGKLAQEVKATPGAIGYISSDYVQRDHLTAVSLRNKRGEWVQPSIEAFSAASRAGGLFKNGLEATPLLDLDGVGVWPIVTATYILVPRSPASPERAGRTLNFFYRSFLLGDKAVAGTGFAPLPLMTQARIVGLLTSFKAQDGRPVPVLGESQKAAPVAARSGATGKHV
ncbi:phosphate ABC transporter substrate-binding protein PstS [Variovorax sp. YR216]|uniref:phosphate ABC transporter substrate-binding protein PstS n=1 Tax=Variovorax sp. YR216 TaxID=1882828 RepID=UPI0008958CD6|nr:phosphate ABC transporter substrate-binding protein PstS [Variovorax sp. YR216]SEB26573.1 phosphate ABC transporter substrate-binding protein, PhoT family [Variovorax sp. YR216]